ncbi:hypothetical protein Cfor_08867, partial [Coptotermes formosanus]
CDCEWSHRSHIAVSQHSHVLRIAKWRDAILGTLALVRMFISHPVIHPARGICRDKFQPRSSCSCSWVCCGSINP